MKNFLPEGYSSRPATWDDMDNMVAMVNAAARAITGRDEITAKDYQVDLQLPAFHLETDLQLVLSPEGEVVGLCEFWDLAEPHVRYNIWGRVHPDHRNNGIGSYLLEWVDRRAEKSMLHAPDGARVILQSYVPALLKDADVLFCQNGYQLIRHALRMVISLNGTPPEPVWAQGIQVRTLEAGEDIADVVRAIRDSFRDHWGFIEAPFEQDYERWKHFVLNDENYDPSLWFLAMDCSEIAGISLCWAKSFDDPEMGWVGTLGVRRPWRQRGLGMALLQHSFAEFHRRGKQRVGLGVDAQSLTGATRLYLKAGMQPDPTFEHVLYEKELRPGIDLSTQTLS
jgi:GNAT superfamily N-acetyltransferase